MKRTAFTTGICIAQFLGSASCAHAENADGTIRLFNGKNLAGWHVAYRDEQMDKNLFTVHDNMIHMYERQTEQSEQTFAGLITDESFSHYILRLEYKWGKKKFAPRESYVRDSGVLFHVGQNESIWPTSVEFQIQEGDTGDIWVLGTMVTSKVSRLRRNYDPEGELVTRGGPNNRYDRFHRGYQWEQPGWNRLERTVRGDHAVYKVNGMAVNEAIDMKYYDETERSWRPLTEGKILLQAEGSEVYYRNITLTPLSN